MEQLGNLDENDRNAAVEELLAPSERVRRDPAKVPQSVVDEEMSMFANFSRQTKAGGV